MPKTRINISLDQDIADFARLFAAENRITVADLMTQYLLNLKRKVEGRKTAKSGDTLLNRAPGDVHQNLVDG